MPDSELTFTRDYDLPVTIVWDALVDEDLLDGWLAPASIDARTAGRYRLSWRVPSGAAPTLGVITTIDAPTRLVVETDNAGLMDFALEEREGGTRGSHTRLSLRLVVGTDRRLLASTRANWLCRLDQLEELLRGHPVDWATWDEDRGETWANYLEAAAAR